MGAPARERPRTIAAMRKAAAGLRTPEGEAAARAFRPRAHDVIIATYPKSGTTWMQQIVHGLRSGGSMAFDEITAAVPWIEMAHDLGHDLDADQVGSPRAFKSHDSWQLVPKGARYIYVMRDPKDVAVSFYRFFEGWFFEPDSITLDAFVREHFADGSRSGRYWDHVASWWPKRQDADTLFFAYEDMQADLQGAVRRVAAFLGVGEAAVDVAARQATLDFMKRHERQFDDHLLRGMRDEACGLPPGSRSTKVRTGEVGGHRAVLGAELERFLDDIWRREIEARLGYPDYATMRAALSAG